MSYRQFAYVYDRLMADMPYGEWLKFAEESFSKFGKPKTIVDLGCGTGNIAIPLAQAGYEVVGIDLSEDMLSIASEKTERLQGPTGKAFKGSVTWLHQDMREWEWSEPADTVISFCDCLNYLLEEEDWKNAFERVYAGLKPGGLFLFDMHAAIQLESYLEQQPFVYDEEELAYIWTCDYDKERSEIEHALTIFAVDEASASERYRKFVEYHQQRAYPLEWVKEALSETGFMDIGCYADFTWERPTQDTRRIFVAAVKR